MKKYLLLGFIFTVFSFQFKCNFDGVASASQNAFSNKAVGAWVYTKPSSAGSIVYILGTSGSGVYSEDGQAYVRFSFTLERSTLSVNMSGASVAKFIYDYISDTMTDPDTGNVYNRDKP